MRPTCGPKLLLPVLLAAGLYSGCASQTEARGFALPSGDELAGRAAFVELRCYACHRVSDETMPRPVATPPIPLVLGGKRLIIPSDGELVTAIIHPSHEINKAVSEQVATSGGGSRMGDYKSIMSVQELVDLVSYLKGRYEQKPMGTPIPVGNRTAP